MATGSKQGGSKQRSTKQRSSSGSSKSTSTRSSGSSKSRNGRSSGSNGRITAAKVARHAIEQMQQLTTQPVEGVRGVRRGDDGGWEVILDVVELKRIPDSTDVLGCYVLVLDDQGEVEEFRRIRRYHRNAVEED